MHTAGLDTVFFIFTYLRGISLWSFRHYGSSVALYHFFSYKPGDFRLYFELSEKSYWGCRHSEQCKNKYVLKPWYLLYGSAPRAPRGVKRSALNTPFDVWCTKIAPKLKNILKAGFWHFFWRFFKVCAFFWTILVQELNCFICKKICFFDTPWTPEGASI